MQAFVLLLGVIDLGKLVELLKDSEALSSESHQLGSHEHRQEADQVLQGLINSFGEGTESTLPCLYLAWATFLCLSNTLDKSGALSSLL